jgi:hypothetical protein
VGAAIEPFLSTEIEKGSRWSGEIETALEGTRFGIICLTRENLAAPWILFEAGALSKTVDAFVWTFSVDIAPTDVSFPLAKFQHTKAEKSDVRRLLHTINHQVDLAGERAVPEHALDEILDLFWPQFEEQLRGAMIMREADTRGTRSERELLEEVLEILRQDSRQVPQTTRYRSVANLAAFIERVIKEKELLAAVEIDWKIEWDTNDISLRATRHSVDLPFVVSVPIRANWPQGSSWSYAVEVAEELKRLLIDAMEQ